MITFGDPVLIAKVREEEARQLADATDYARVRILEARVKELEADLDRVEFDAWIHETDDSEQKLNLYMDQTAKTVARTIDYLKTREPDAGADWLNWRACIESLEELVSNAEPKTITIKPH